jgi:hypothetical protein
MIVKKTKGVYTQIVDMNYYSKKESNFLFKVRLSSRIINGFKINELRDFQIILFKSCTVFFLVVLIIYVLVKM